MSDESTGQTDVAKQKRLEDLAAQIKADSEKRARDFHRAMTPSPTKIIGQALLAIAGVAWVVLQLWADPWMGCVIPIGPVGASDEEVERIFAARDRANRTC